jgi:hypothetical protein
VIEPAKKSKSPGPDLSKINGGTAAREISLGTQQKIALYFRGIRAGLTRQAHIGFNRFCRKFCVCTMRAWNNDVDYAASE